MCISEQVEYDALDPNLGDVGPGRPRYWWADFARAEHTRQYNTSRTHAVLCPFNCSAELADAVYAGPVQPNVFGDYAAQVTAHIPFCFAHSSYAGALGLRGMWSLLLVFVVDRSVPLSVFHRSCGRPSWASSLITPQTTGASISALYKLHFEPVAVEIVQGLTVWYVNGTIQGVCVAASRHRESRRWLYAPTVQLGCALNVAVP